VCVCVTWVQAGNAVKYVCVCAATAVAVCVCVCVCQAGDNVKCVWSGLLCRMRRPHCLWWPTEKAEIPLQLRVLVDAVRLLIVLFIQLISYCYIVLFIQLISYCYIVLFIQLLSYCPYSLAGMFVTGECKSLKRRTANSSTAML
jgi:hypothetical protein